MGKEGEVHGDEKLGAVFIVLGGKGGYANVHSGTVLTSVTHNHY